MLRLEGIHFLPARIIDRGGSVIATVGTGAEERVTLPNKGREAFFQDGEKATIAGTEEGFDLFQLNENGDRKAQRSVGPGKKFKAVHLAHGLTAEGIKLV